jgi:hypothetical protein
MGPPPSPYKRTACIKISEVFTAVNDRIIVLCGVTQGYLVHGVISQRSTILIHIFFPFEVNTVYKEVPSQEMKS